METLSLREEILLNVHHGELLIHVDRCGLAERDPGGTQADTGGGGAVAGRESAEGLGAEGIQAGGVLGGAAGALRHSPAT